MQVRSKTCSPAVISWVRDAVEASPRGKWGEQEVVSLWSSASVLIMVGRGASGSKTNGDEEEGGGQEVEGWAWEGDEKGVWGISERMAEEAMSIQVGVKK